MASDTEILAELTLAEEHIATAKSMIAGGPVPPPPDLFVPVNPGDNLMAMIADHPAGTRFRVHDEFVQSCGIEAVFAKPCTLLSQHARLIGIFTVQPDTHFIGMTLDGANQNTILTGADNVTVDGCTLNGYEGGQHRGILVNCKGMRIRNTKILNIARDIDTQAIAGWDGTDDLEILGCELEASGENILFGGADSTSEQRMPRNIRIEGNYLSKRREWWTGPQSCKNLIELKAGVDVTIANNVMEYSWSDAQVGYGIVLTVRNNDCGAPWSTIKNVLFDCNTMRHVAGGFQILGRDDRPGVASVVMSNVTIRNTLVEDMSNEWGWNGRQFFISGGPDRLTLEGNEFHCTTIPNSALCFDQPEYLCTNLVVREQKQFVEGEYGIFGTSSPGLGQATLDFYAPGYVWDNNTVQKSGVSYINWPPGTNFVYEGLRCRGR